jgi:hypothetical protein
MANIVNAVRSFFRPRLSIAFGTVITSLVQSANRLKTKVTRAKYTAGGTAHTLTFLRPLGSKVNPPGPQGAGNRLCNAYATAAVAAGATSIILNRDPGAYAANFLTDRGAGAAPLTADNLIASGDLLGIETAVPGVLYLATVSGSPVTNADGTVTVTITAAPTGGIPKYGQVFFFGTTTDVDPRTGEAHPQFSGTASVTTDLFADGGSVVESVEVDEPMLFHSNNATATGTLELISGMYGP